MMGRPTKDGNMKDGKFDPAFPTFTNWKIKITQIFIFRITQAKSGKHYFILRPKPQGDTLTLHYYTTEFSSILETP